MHLPLPPPLVSLIGTVLSIPIVAWLLGLVKLPAGGIAKMFGSYFLTLFRQGRSELHGSRNNFIKVSFINLISGVLMKLKNKTDKPSRAERRIAKYEKKAKLAAMSKAEKIAYKLDLKKAKAQSKGAKPSAAYKGIRKLTHVGMGLSGSAAAVLGAAAYHSFNAGSPKLAGAFGGASLLASGLAAYPSVKASRKLSSGQDPSPAEAPAENPQSAPSVEVVDNSQNAATQSTVSTPPPVSGRIK